MSGLLGAVAFLTRLPTGRTATQVNPARSVPFVPVVGALVGLAVAGAYIGMSAVLPGLTAAGLAVTAGIVLTGALHEDGLADAVDALGARDRAEVLRILRDPTHGTYGVLALAASFVLRVAAVGSFDRRTALIMLPTAHALSRVAAVAVVTAGPPLATDGLGATYAPAVRRGPLALSIALVLVAAIALLQVWAVVAVAVTVGLAAVGGRLAVSRLGGVNGDVAGACEQLVEVGLLIAASGSHV